MELIIKAHFLAHSCRAYSSQVLQKRKELDSAPFLSELPSFSVALSREGEGKQYKNDRNAAGCWEKAGFIAPHVCKTRNTIFQRASLALLLHPAGNQVERRENFSAIHHQTKRWRNTWEGETHQSPTWEGRKGSQGPPAQHSSQCFLPLIRGRPRASPASEWNGMEMGWC